MKIDPRLLNCLNDKTLSRHGVPVNKSHRWNIKLRLEREGTGQWFASFDKLRAGKRNIGSGVCPYGDTEEEAIANALRVISDVIQSREMKPC